MKRDILQQLEYQFPGENGRDSLSRPSVISPEKAVKDDPLIKVLTRNNSGEVTQYDELRMMKSHPEEESESQKKLRKSSHTRLVRGSKEFGRGSFKIPK